MKEHLLMEEIEAEGVEIIDLGSATEETRQTYPMPVVIDSIATFGRYFAE